MSGTVTSNVFKASGVIAATPGGLDWSSAVITGSTLSAETGKGYFINTTSNICTITLPASPEIGDQIVFADYARTWATYNLIIDSNGNNFQGEPDTFTVDYDTAGQSLNIVYSDSTKGWLPVSDDAVANAPVAPVTQKGIFAFGNTGPITNISSLVSSSGVISADVSGVGTARQQCMSASYGGDKAIFAYGTTGSQTNIRNLVNNSGVVASDATGAGTAKSQGAGVAYGSDKAIIAFGNDGSYTNTSNLVSNSGVVGSDVTGVGSPRGTCAGAGYGVGLGIIGYGYLSSGRTAITNKISSSGVVASDTSGVGTVRGGLDAAAYGGDKAIFAYGDPASTNLVSNTGVVAANVTSVGTYPREGIGATNYGGDKAIFFAGSGTGVSNLVSNTGVVASDTASCRNSLRQCNSGLCRLFI